MENISLIQLNPGDKGHVKRICAGGCATKRLYEMGLNTGARFQVVKNDAGPIILHLSGNKIALGRGLAQKIIVSD